MFHAHVARLLAMISTSVLFLVSSSAVAQSPIEDWMRKVQATKSTAEFNASMTQLEQFIAANAKDPKVYHVKMRLAATVAYPRNYSAVIEGGEAASKQGLKTDHSLLGRAYLEMGDYGKAREQLQKLETTSSNKHAPITNLASYIKGITRDPSFTVELQRLESMVSKLAESKGTAPTRATAVAALMSVGADISARRFLPQLKSDSEASGWTMRQYANEILILQGDYSSAEEWLGKALANGDDKAQWDLARLLVRKGDFATAESLLRKALSELDGGSLFLQSVHQYPIRAALAKTLNRKKDLEAAKQLLLSSPALETKEQATSWYLHTILWPRLQMAEATQDQGLVKAAAEHLYKALAQRRGATGGRNDVEPKLLFDLLRALDSNGHGETAKALAGDTLNQVADTRLPWHKAARAQALKVLGKSAEAKTALAEAFALAPGDIWIRDALEEIGS